MSEKKYAELVVMSDEQKKAADLGLTVEEQKKCAELELVKAQQRSASAKKKLNAAKSAYPFNVMAVIAAADEVALADRETVQIRDLIKELFD